VVSIKYEKAVATQGGLCGLDLLKYRGAAKSLARPVRKQVIFLSEWREFPSALCLAEKRNLTARVPMLLKSLWPLTSFRACFFPGRPKDLSVPRIVTVSTYRTYFGIYVVVRDKVHPRTDHEDAGRGGGQICSSTLAWTSTLVGGGVGSGQRHASTALPQGKTRYPLYRRLGGSQGGSRMVRKISPSPAFDPLTVQPVASRYTDWAMPAHVLCCIK